jgi:hypothetical protein
MSRRQTKAERQAELAEWVVEYVEGERGRLANLARARPLRRGEIARRLFICRRCGRVRRGRPCGWEREVRVPGFGSICGLCWDAHERCHGRPWRDVEMSLLWLLAVDLRKLLDGRETGDIWANRDAELDPSTRAWIAVRMERDDHARRLDDAPLWGPEDPRRELRWAARDALRREARFG